MPEIEGVPIALPEHVARRDQQITIELNDPDLGGFVGLLLLFHFISPIFLKWNIFLQHKPNKNVGYQYYYIINFVICTLQLLPN